MGIFRKLLSFNEKLDKKISHRKTMACLRDGVLIDKLKVIARIGTPSIQGEVFLVELENSPEKLVIKKIPLSKNFFNRKGFSTIVISKSVFLTEVFFLYCCKILLKEKITPYLPFMYHFTICENDCGFTNTKITNQYDKGEIQGCGHLIVEKAKSDLANFLDNYIYTFPQLLIIFYQIFSGLCTLKYYTNMFHGDLHQGNVLFKEIGYKKGFVKFTWFNGKTHYIPNIGYVFFIWDFGISRAEPFISNPDYNNSYKGFTHLDDVLRLVRTLDPRKAKERKMRSLISNLLVKSSNILDFVDLLYQEIKKIRPFGKKDVIIDSYTLVKKNDKLLYNASTYIQRKI